MEQKASVLERAGYGRKEIQERLGAWFDEMFTPGTPQCIYGEDEYGGYLIDTGNNDVRTEGQSYGMMMAVQRDRQDIFDKIWAWTYRFMRQREGKYEGYFAWSCSLSGEHNAEGPAPDGEEYMAMALFFASHRWGDREEPFDYGRQARELLRRCVHQHELTGGEGEPMWEPENHLIRFVPETKWTDPSYHLPHFYELFAQWSYDEDKEFWKTAANESRKLIVRSAHEKTGLCPEYSDYDGTPHKSSWGAGDTFYSDAYRVVMNIALDTQWFGEREEYKNISARQQAFFNAVNGDELYEYAVDGTRLERKALHPVGLTAAVAASAVCYADGDTEKWIKRFMETPLRTDERRYFDSDLCYFALLILSGEYRIW